jgi:hypothetical protein
MKIALNTPGNSGKLTFMLNFLIYDNDIEVKILELK